MAGGINDGAAGSMVWKGVSPTSNVGGPSSKASPGKSWDGSPVKKPPATPGTPVAGPTALHPTANPAVATPISPFYAKRTSDTTPAMSAAAKMFREGAEKIVLDKDKQDKLANLIKAVTLQKAQLTEERELAIEGFKAERAKLRGMQHKTLALYSKLRASVTTPEGLGVADWSDGDGGGDESDEDAGSGQVLDTAATAMRFMRAPPDRRMMLSRWHSWAKNHAAMTRRVARLRERWFAGRARKWVRGWRDAATPGAAAHLAAEASARRSRRRLARRVFVNWRGLAEGLAAHELALLSSGNAMLAVGSPAAGLAAVAALARPGGGSETTRRDAVAAAIAAAGRSGEFDVDDILEELGEDVYETPAASAYATPMTSPAPMMSAAAAKAQVAAAKAAVERAVAARTPEADAKSPKSPSGVAGRFSNPPSPSPLRMPEDSPKKATPPSSPKQQETPKQQASPKQAAESPPPPAASPPASPGAVSLSLSQAEEPSNPAGGLPATPRASSSLGDEMLKMAFERSHVAEAAVAALFGRRARDEGRRALAAWNLATARSRADRLEEELSRLRFAQAEAEANAEAAAEASSPSPPAKKKSGTLFALASFKSKKSPRTSADSPDTAGGQKAARSFANPFETEEKAPAEWSEPAAMVSPAPPAAAGSPAAKSATPAAKTASPAPDTAEKTDSPGLPQLPPEPEESGEEKKKQPGCGCVIM